MQIKDELDLSLLTKFLNKWLYRGHLRAILIFITDVPFSIQILTHKVASIVAERDSIWIDHRYHINHKILQQKIHFLDTVE